MKNIVVLVSGGGTNLQALIDAEKSGIIKNGKITGKKKGTATITVNTNGITLKCRVRVK